jgi:hypothetical protein
MSFQFAIFVASMVLSSGKAEPRESAVLYQKRRPFGSPATSSLSVGWSGASL